MKDWSNLAKVVYKRTYARNDSGKLENWKDTVERVIRGNVKNHKVDANEIERLRYFMLNRKAIPAGRGLWYSGSPSHSKIGGVALNNCWAVSADDFNNFVLAMDLLMLGGGVGLSIEHRFVSKLPKVKKDVVIVHKESNDADYIVPDSRQGWCELFRRVLESYFVTGKSFSYSTICVRGGGKPIKGFGGTSSGPEPLVKFINNIQLILFPRSGKHVRPIDAMDIICSTGEMVVSGNVRRSALIILGDCFDKEYLKSKRWDIAQIPTYRAFANLSVVVDDIEDLHPLFWKTYENGEPFGIVNRKNIQTFGRMGERKKDTATMVNPCQPQFANLTLASGKVITMGELKVGDVLLNKNNKETIVIKKWSTGIKPVYSYGFNGGSFVGTSNHKVVSKNTGNDLVEKIEIDTVYNKEGKVLTENGWQRLTGKHYIGEHEVFDITVSDETHTYLTNGIYVSNCAEATLENAEPCNLQEIALANIESEDEFIEAAKLMHRYGKRVTLENFHHDKINEVIKRNRRIGTGITGCLESSLFNPKTLDRVYAEIQKENVSYSKELGIPESIRTTVVKPSGTVSKLLDQRGEGIHPAYSKHMIQRVRFAANDPLIPLLKRAGHYMEPVVKFDGELDHSTLVVDFYLEAPEGMPCADSDFDTWKQLDTLLLAQKHWADQAVSVTVYYKKEEIPLVKNWLNDNLKYLKSISFLCHNDHGFKQAPKEAITKEEYQKRSENIKPIEFTDNADFEAVELGLECQNGICPIK